jgi:hypothetical protein
MEIFCVSFCPKKFVDFIPVGCCLLRAGGEPGEGGKEWGHAMLSGIWVDDWDVHPGMESGDGELPIGSLLGGVGMG